jgi:hypothetical protein
MPANTLIKTSTITYVPGTPGRPAFGGQAYVAPYCVQGEFVWEDYLEPPQMKYEPLPAGIDGGIYSQLLPAGSVPVKAPDPKTGRQEIIGFMVPIIGTGGIKHRQVWVPGVKCYPGQAFQAPSAAVAPSAAQFLIDHQVGWTGGARAIRNLPSSGRVEFKAPLQTTGAVAGLNDIDADAGYQNIEHAWYVSNGVAKVVESGFIRFNHGAFAAGDLFAVERISGVVRYKVNGTVVYTSLVPSAGPVIFDASLYVGKDYIYDPAIFDYITSEASFEPLESLSSTYAYNEASNRFEYFTSSSEELFDCANSFELFIGRSADYDYSDSYVTMEPFQSFSSSDLLLPDFMISSVFMQPMLSSAVESNFEPFGVDATFELLESLSSDYDYNEATNRFEFFLSESQERINVDMELPEWVFTLDLWEVPSYKYVLFDTDLSMAALMVTDKSIDLLLNSLVTATASLSLVANYTLLINSFIQAGFSFPVLSNDNQVWVVSEAGQTSRYEGYAFNSFGKFNGQYYGAKEDGIYLLEGDTDQGEPVRASVNFGKQNFGTALKKHVSNCYLGVSSSGKMYLKVTADGNEYVYQARGSSEEMEMQRVDIGRGIRANFLIFELFNNDGCDFDLASVEFVVIPSSTRRI